MSTELLAIIGIIVLIILLFLRMWIGMAMIIVGFVGFAIVRGLMPALSMIAQLPFQNVNNYPLTTIPLFVFMGVVLFNTGIGKDLYDAGYAWVGSLRGGLAMATVVACAIFGAITGISAPALVTMGKVAIPEMKKHGYSDSFACGSVACSGTLAILIPPSIPLILYGILTQNSVGKLFMAGIIPGILLSVLFIAVIVVWTRINPAIGPAGPKTTWKRKIVSTGNIWPTILLVLLVLGGIYGGIFSPTEAGAIGAFGTCVITALMRRLNFKIFTDSLLEATRMTAFIALLITGAYVMSKFFAVSGLPALLSETLTGMHAPGLVLFFLIVLYLILGMVLDIMSAVLVTIPVVYPIIIALGFDPIWFGIMLTILTQMGLVTPPVGLDVFVLGGSIKVPLYTIFKGVTPFVIMDLVCIIILIFFPQVATWLPSTM